MSKKFRPIFKGRDHLSEHEREELNVDYDLLIFDGAHSVAVLTKEQHGIVFKKEQSDAEWQISILKAIVEGQKWFEVNRFGYYSIRPDKDNEFTEAICKILFDWGDYKKKHKRG